MKPLRGDSIMQDNRVQFSLSRKEVQDLLWLLNSSKLDPSKFSPSPFRVNFDQYNEVKGDFKEFLGNKLAVKQEVSK